MKRPRLNQKAAYSVRKRRKLQDASRPPSASPKRRRIRLDELQWRDVSMPDRLEDFEGFYGLEEIDGVEVMKDDATGQISFETSKTEDEVEREKEEAKRQTQEEEVALNQDVANDDEESWEGLSDTSAGSDCESEEQNGVQSPHHGSSMTSHLDTEDGGNTQGLLRKLERKQGEKKSDGDAVKQVHDAKTLKSNLNKQTNGLQEDVEVDSSAFDVLADRNEEDDLEDEMDVSAWHDLDLSAQTLASLSRLNFTKPTSIQSAAIPEIMAGRDVVGKASTGSGKTLAFGIPILESYLANPTTSKPKTPIALIVSPTRELAHQLSAHLTALCTSDEFTSPIIATVTGGLSVQKQRRLLEKADVIVGTPGRLWEVIESGQGLMGSIKQIRFLVVDEADRLLSEGHYKELGHILDIFSRDAEVDDLVESKASPELHVQRQTLVFSATFQKGLQQKLAGKGPKGGDLMNKQESVEYLMRKLRFKDDKPKYIDANPTSQMASRLKEGLVECAGLEKDLYTYAILLYHRNRRALIFTNSVAAVRRLTPFLQNLNLPALPLHSGMEQKARLRSIERFKSRPGSILVATDVAARGLDIPGVELVVHYHLPRAADTYIHRSGRTARAEASGSSILICAPEEVAGVRRLVAKVHARAEQANKSKKTAHYIRTLDIDRRIVSRLKPRATLSKKIADATIAKEKKHSEEDWMRAAAEELGVDYDSETFEQEAKGRRGRGSGRKKKEKEAREMSKGEVQALRAELKGMLSQRINAGVSARYLTSGGIDVDALMEGEGNMEFLGDAGGLGFED